MLARSSIITEDLEYIIEGLDFSPFYGKTILISGATGFLPAYMIETLLFLNEHTHSKIKMIGLARNAEKAQKNYPHFSRRPDFEWLIQDVTSPMNINVNIDFIVHAASQASPKFFGSDPVGTLSANVLGTYQLLKLAQAKRSEGFLFFSSGEVYGQVSPSQIPMKENDYGFLDPTDVRSCYGESKRMGENLCVSFFHQFGVPTKIVRPFHTYGPGFSLDDGRVFADFVSDIVHGRNIQMKSDGSAVRPYCYLSDATKGFFTVLLRGEKGQAYNIGNDKAEVSVLELANLLVNLFPEKNLKVIKRNEASREGYLKSPINRNCPDITKAKSIGWNPRVTLQEGFTKTVRSFYESK